MPSVSSVVTMCALLIVNMGCSPRVSQRELKTTLGIAELAARRLALQQKKARQLRANLALQHFDRRLRQLLQPMGLVCEAVGKEMDACGMAALI